MGYIYGYLGFAYSTNNISWVCAAVIRRVSRCDTWLDFYKMPLKRNIQHCIDLGLEATLPNNGA